MRARVGIVAAALVVVVALGLVILRWPRTDAPPLPSADALAPPATGATGGRTQAGAAAEPTRPEPSAPGDPSVAAAGAVASARTRRAAAQSELSAAEAELEDREREVAELERFIADLEARGEDPAQHAEEGLALFGPAHEGYQRTVARIESAQTALRAADADLAQAEAALRAGSARDGTDPAN